ncbi:MAG TPA: SIR2 family protein [Pirellulales bacterium]|nr:SIR2 family protein [Pirellulales bacterium]
MTDGTSRRNVLLEDLRKRIAQGNAILIVGAGISISASGNAPAASWKGLLQNGLDRCIGLRLLEVPEAENLRRLLESNKADMWLVVAQAVEKFLKKSLGEFGVWLHDSVGTLSVVNREILEAIANLKLPLWTTNYDGLLERTTKFLSVTWRQTSKVESVAKGELQAIVHLHGYFDDPDSVVLGVSSYDEIVKDEHTQIFIRSGFLTKTLVFVGFGKGLDDPNFGALLAWANRVFANSQYRHYRLVRDAECAVIEAERDANDRVYPISYGATHDALIPFLQSLVDGNKAAVPTATSEPLPTTESQQRTIDSFHAEIDIAKGYTERGEPNVAIALLEKLRTRYSSEFNNRIWYRVLANIARAHEENGDFEKAASLYLQAKDYEPDNPDARCFEAVGYFLRGEVEKAHSLAIAVKTAFPNHSLAYAVWARSAPLSLEFTKLENGVPVQFRRSLYVANALMFAASHRQQFEQAMSYGRLTLEAEPNSPMLMEQLGSVLTDYARFQARDTEADVPSAGSRALAIESLDLLNRALPLRQKAPAKTRASIYLRLAMAYTIIGNETEKHRCVRLAYDLDPQNPDVVLQFALTSAANNEFSTAIALIKSLKEIDEYPYIRYVLSSLYLSDGDSFSDTDGLICLLAIVPKLKDLDHIAQYITVCNIIAIYVRRQETEKAEEIFAQLPSDFPPFVPDLFRAVLQRKLGNVHEAKQFGLKAFSIADVDQSPFHRALARELANLTLNAEALSIWKHLLKPEYLSIDTRMAVSSAANIDDAEFILDFCPRLRANGFYDHDCVSAEFNILNKFNCIDTLAATFDDCLKSIPDEKYKQVLRVNQALLGFELAKDEWICHDLDLLPRAQDTTPQIGQAVVQILKAGNEPLNAVRYAYELLRRNFASKDANMAMIHSVLSGEKLDIPEPEAVVPGVAVAYQENNQQVRWWIVEDSPNPERCRNELAPEHPLAALLHGKKVGEQVQIRDAELQARVAKILELKSKYVFRFQQCLSEFEEYFIGGNTFLMQFSTASEESKEPDIGPMLRSVEQRASWIKDCENDYLKTLPSMNFFARKTQTRVYQAGLLLKN